MRDPGLELEKYVVIAAARVITEAWPAAARAEFAEFVLKATRAELPALDGETERERAANARELARYWFRDWASAEPRVPSAEQRAPRIESRAPSTEQRAPRTEPRVPSTEPREPRTDDRGSSTEHRAPSLEHVAQLADWAARFGVAHAVDLWRYERGRN